jgi:hypothetical protein
MIASVADYPSLLERLRPPHLFHDPELLGLIVLLLVTSIYAVCHLWRARRLTVWSVILVVAPTFIGCGLAALQCRKVEQIAVRNERGMSVMLRPDRFIGQIRDFLNIGMSTSVVLLVIAQVSRYIPRHEQDA